MGVSAPATAASGALTPETAAGGDVGAGASAPATATASGALTPETAAGGDVGAGASALATATSGGGQRRRGGGFGSDDDSERWQAATSGQGLRLQRRQ
ncbi:hypothetical protein GUJ93_ZPchr0011g27922 [Zizania palustris]|uniref:Uncharacterized protein n=1 Tax=Zizania palustris TaxID=103762 RepID=A0A8J5WJA2_ZIZPA|nr:hypothetical protein GUJ93_ZPchr0011g27922 [Zizania palustris]